MEEVLAIKPDIVFVWDEAWYAFASFLPLAKQRTAMYSARVLEERYASSAYRAEYAAWRERLGPVGGFEQLRRSPERHQFQREAAEGGRLQWLNGRNHRAAGRTP